MTIRPEYLAKMEEQDQKKGKGGKKGNSKKAGKDEDTQNSTAASINKKKKGGKGKKDPVDQFDPLNFKPTRVEETEEDRDLAAQLANYEFKCSACPFGTNVHEEFKSHFKCDWHKINTQRKVAHQVALTEEEFKELIILKEFA